MNNFIKKIANNGLGEESNIIERRRIRLLNVFSLVVTVIILTYVIVNLSVGSFKHAGLLSSGFFVLILPVYFFTYKQNHTLSRIYFVIGALIIMGVVGYNSILNFDNRHNEVLFIGFSAIIIILYDNPLKIVFFAITLVSCLTMYIFRWDHLGSEYGVDMILSFTNITMSFVCIYLFTSIFKDDLLKSLDKTQQYSSDLELQQRETITKHNDLVANRQLLRTLIDNLPILIALMDIDENYLIVNSRYEEVFDIRMDNIEGKNSKDVLSKELFESRKPLIERCLAGKEAILDYPIKLASGEIMHAYGKYLPLFDENEEVTGFLVYVTDITKLKHAETELKELNNTKNKLLSIVSHDLKGPINSLKGLLYLSDKLTVSEMKKLMEEVGNQVDSVSFTMDNLLTWVRTQFDGFRIAPQHFDISEVAKESIELYKEQISNKKLKVSIKEDEPTSIFADKDNMSLVCRNLISNAIKFTPSGGVITILYSRDIQQTVISVSDTGMGISQEDIEIIMNDSKQNITRKGTAGELGTGLGLAFCKDVLAMNNAKMELLSEINLGTEVRVIFPNN